MKKYEWTIEDYKEALLLAGALAQSCENLQKVDWRTLHIRMETMCDYLEQYNECIFRERKIK